MRLTLSICLASLLAPCLRGDSLWSPTSPFANLFADNKAHQIGDIITILISESAQATHTATVDHEHEADSQIGPGEGLLDFIPLVGWGGRSESGARGASTRGGSLVARITAMVVNITPTGNLVLEGKHSVKVNEDMQEISIKGEVRPRDVAPDNTVLSQYIANAEIIYTGVEPERPTRHSGLITRILNILF